MDVRYIPYLFPSKLSRISCAVFFLSTKEVGGEGLACLAALPTPTSRIADIVTSSLKWIPLMPGTT